MDIEKLENMIGVLHYENMMIIKILLQQSLPKEKAEKEYKEIEEKTTKSMLDIVNGTMEIFVVDGGENNAR